jgi:hypothetical protein
MASAIHVSRMFLFLMFCSFPLSTIPSAGLTMRKAFAGFGQAVAVKPSSRAADDCIILLIKRQDVRNTGMKNQNSLLLPCFSPFHKAFIVLPQRFHIFSILIPI